MVTVRTCDSPLGLPASLLSVYQTWQTLTLTFAFHVELRLGRQTLLLTIEAGSR